MKPLFRLLAAASVLAVVVAVMYWPKKAPPAAPAAPPLVKVDVGLVQRLEITQPGQPAVVVTRNGSDWKLEQPYAAAADDAAVVGLLGTLGNITDAQDVGASANPAAFGLDQPSVVQLDLSNGQTEDFDFGSDTPTGGSSYLRMGANGGIKIVPNYIKENAVKTAFMLQDKKILSFPADQLTAMDVTAQGKKVTLPRTNSQWPKDQQSNAQALLDALGDAQMTAMTDPTGKDAAKYGLGHPVATLKLTWPAGSAQLEIGDKKGAAEYYARSSASPAVFTLSDYLVTDIQNVVTPPKPDASTPQ